MLESGAKPHRRVTLRDIAKQAGVSVTTASLVLSNKAKERALSDEAIERVRKVAAELDYSPNFLSQSLRRGRTDTLGFYNAFRERFEHDFYLDLLEVAIDLAGGRHGFDITTYCAFTRSVKDTYRHLNSGRCDGLLFFAPRQDDLLLPYIRSSQLPTVLINAVDTEGVLCSVSNDYMDGMRQVADALCHLGHRRVAMLSIDPQINQDGDLRVSALRKLLMERGVVSPERWMLKVDKVGGSPEVPIRFLLSEPSPPTAIFCWHDRLGYAVLKQCEELGISVPDQVSIIGYDGIEWPAKTYHTLASVKVDIDNLAETSVALLEQLINGQVDEPAIQVLGVSLQHGTTLAKAPRT